MFELVRLSALRCRTASLQAAKRSVNNFQHYYYRVKRSGQRMERGSVARKASHKPRSERKMGERRKDGKIIMLHNAENDGANARRSERKKSNNENFQMHNASNNLEMLC